MNLVSKPYVFFVHLTETGINANYPQAYCFLEVRIIPQKNFGESTEGIGEIEAFEKKKQNFSCKLDGGSQWLSIDSITKNKAKNRTMEKHLRGIIFFK